VPEPEGRRPGDRARLRIDRASLVGALRGIARGNQLGPQPGNRIPRLRASAVDQIVPSFSDRKGLETGWVESWRSSLPAARGRQFRLGRGRHVS